MTFFQKPSKQNKIRRELNIPTISVWAVDITAENCSSHLQIKYLKHTKTCIYIYQCSDNVIDIIHYLGNSSTCHHLPHTCYQSELKVSFIFSQVCLPPAQNFPFYFIVPIPIYYMTCRSFCEKFSGLMDWGREVRH